jgi:hypothetical protein
VAIARRSSELGKDEWLEFAMENPIPEILQYYDYDHIAKAFGGKGAQRSSRDRDDDDRDDDRRRDRDGDDRRRSRDDDPPRRTREDDDDRPSKRSREAEEPTWDSIHEMTKSELVDLIEEKDLGINPKEAKDTEDLADWVCEELKIKKAKKEEKRSREDDNDAESRLAAMRRRREERD